MKASGFEGHGFTCMNASTTAIYSRVSAWNVAKVGIKKYF